MPTTFDIPIDEWQAVQAGLRGDTLVAGRNVRRDQSDRQVIVHAAAVEPWQHPWWTSGRWFDGAWRVSVRPGFVNGLDPLFQGAPLFANSRQLGEVSLLDAPEVAVSGWRAVGGELGEGSERVPAFFLAKGVAPAKEAGDHTLTRPAGERQLRAIDVVLSVARPTLTGSAEIVDPTAISGVEVVYRVGVDTTAVERIGTRPRLRLETQYTPPKAPSLAERLVGLYSDPTEDTRLISTLYLLSPRETDAAAEPDATWEPFAKHATFWNLQHATRNAVPAQPPAPIRLFTGLLGGLGDALGNQILAQINEFSDRVENAVNNVSLEGKFYQ